MLSSFPLCVEWLPYQPGSLSTGGAKGNYVIVGSFLPEIEIWNLDELNALEPAYTLGGAVQPKKQIKKFKQKTVPLYSKNDRNIYPEATRTLLCVCHSIQQEGMYNLYNH